MCGLYLSALESFSEESTVIFIRRLFERLAAVPHKVIIFLEDFSGWFCQRNSALSNKQYLLREQFMSKLTDEPRKYMVIATALGPLKNDCCVPFFSRHVTMKYPDDEVKKGILFRLRQNPRSDEQAQQARSWFSWLF